MAAMQHVSYELILAFRTGIVPAGQAGINGCVPLPCLCSPRSIVSGSLRSWSSSRRLITW